MGGLLIISALLTSTLLWARWDNPFVWMVLFVTLSFALLGFADDYAKVTKQTTAGVSGRIRLAIGFLVAAIAGSGRRRSIRRSCRTSSPFRSSRMPS